MLNPTKQKKVIDVIVSGKGIIPYEKVNSIESLNIKQENRIFLPKINFIVAKRKCSRRRIVWKFKNTFYIT